MYFHAFADLILAASFQLKAVHKPATGASRPAPKGLADLNDHHLRDVGYVRDRKVVPARHVLWM